MPTAVHIDDLPAQVVQQWRGDSLDVRAGVVVDPFYLSSPSSNVFRAVVWACYHYGTAREIRAKQSRGSKVRLWIGGEEITVRILDAADHRQWAEIVA
jgi:hypothetical protein